MPSVTRCYGQAVSPSDDQSSPQSKKRFAPPVHHISLSVTATTGTAWPSPPGLAMVKKSESGGHKVGEPDSSGRGIPVSPVKRTKPIKKTKTYKAKYSPSPSPSTAPLNPPTAFPIVNDCPYPI
ncbi:hypothetical protein BC939DRAFT_477837 [Gamsiella multidivaricata]|uniref:uncharacterized protein n=1 Tax=Gamsiella multidivaricata TaxID=101098 RepID=UPI00221ECAD2|nr:uncharacterized protein BC939DRAFT_477837 [Gamsiella multidivaricata]KAI7822373.1 hypothetical protein BC939DRAFT_477837 [Gamsiella multidivaricata]